MKKKDLPQDGRFSKKPFTTDVCYVKNENNKYEAVESEGWEVKNIALSNVWEDIHEQVAEAKEEVKRGEKSNIHYYMIKCLMDLTTLSAYTGFWRLSIKRHLKPAVFNKLSQKKLAKYAEAFKISVEELKQIND